MAFEVEGKLHKVFDTEQKTDTFKTREFVIVVEEGNYPQFVKFQLVQDKCEMIDGYSDGDKLKVYFDLRGREWQGKYFTNLQAWRVEAVDAKSGVAPLDEDFPTVEPPGAASDLEDEGTRDFDDLPF